MLPTDIIFPFDRDKFASIDSKMQAQNMQDLLNALSDMYQQIAQNVNGRLRDFTPVLKGSTSAGTGTYTNRSAWVLRQGLLTNVWFDVTWTAHTGTGDLYLELPYKVKKTEYAPFSGCCDSSSITFTAGYTYLTLNAQSDTLRANIIQCGSASSRAALAVAASGRLIGHIYYIGQEFEN